MEGARFLVAIVLSIAVVMIVNILFPPTAPDGGSPAADSVPGASQAVDTVFLPRAGQADSPAQQQSPQRAPGAADAGVVDPGVADTGVVDPGVADTGVADTGAVPGQAPVAGPMEQVGPADTVWVETDVARYGISTRGAALVSVELLEFESYTQDGPVQLAESDNGTLLHYGIRTGDRVSSLDALSFDAPIAAGDTLRLQGEGRALTFTATVGGAPVQIAYNFSPGTYLVGVGGQLGAVSGADATLLLGLGPRLAVNEADSAEDLRALAYVVNSRREGIESVGIPDLEANRIEEGPLSWVAIKNKYFLAAALAPEDESAVFGGLLADAGPGGASSIRATLPLDRSGAFDLRLFFGPQQYSRLASVGEGLEDVNPYGWRIFQPIIRPLAHFVLWLLVGLHDVLNLGYGWVLIIFGFAMRGLMWPFNAKAMKSQLKTMEVQPRIKEIQAKYKDKPELLQKEMVRLYKEEGFNPLGGCLPMLVPWPVLITLFFVFQNTIEFRGVDFWWLPDLSRPDPLYLLPVLLGLSLFITQWMNLRASPQQNPQQKMLMYFMPVIMVVIFLNFASGLNLYYAASNVAGIPQQMIIIKERGRARAKLEEKKKE